MIDDGEPRPRSGAGRRFATVIQIIHATKIHQLGEVECGIVAQAGADRNNLIALHLDRELSGRLAQVRDRASKQFPGVGGKILIRVSHGPDSLGASGRWWWYG